MAVSSSSRFVLLSFLISLPPVALALEACSSDDSTPATAGGSDASTDNGSSTSRSDDSGRNNEETDSGSKTDAGKDAGGDGACSGPIVTTPGETCIGFGPKAETCDPACGQSYGYLCFNGAPPGFTGCREQRTSTLGNTYCCPKNDCVAQPDQDTMCNGTAGKPHRYQCPPLTPNDDGGFATPPTGCVEKGSGSSELEKFYCCP